MSKKFALILCLVLTVPFVFGCGESLKFWKKKKEVEVVHKKLPPFEELFNRTVELYNSKQYKDAISALLFLRENYPQKAEYQSRITLYLADSHFHQKEYPEAIANYEEFIKLYPKSPDVPYAYFQIGMSNYKQRRSYDRDATFVRKALENFKKVLEISPPGVLMNESIRMIAFCQRELAMHDFFIADFYMRTHHYKAAYLRYSDILKSYPNLKVYDRAHLGIAKAYLKMKNKNEAYRHLSFVVENYPNTRYGKEAWKLLRKVYKVASVQELPIVTFPKGTLAESGESTPDQAGERSVKGGKPVLPKASETTPKKVAAAHSNPSPPETHAIPQKPSVYFPPVEKTVKVKPEKPSPPPPLPKPEKKAEKPSEAGSSTPKTTSVKEPAPPKPVSPAVQKTASTASRPEANKPVEKPAVSSSPASKPEVKKPTPPKKEVVEKKANKVVKAEEKGASVSGKPEHDVKAPPAETASPAPEKQAVSPKAEAPTKAAKKLEKPSVSSSPKRPEAVKTMVKTDRLPPKRKKEKASSGLVGAIDTRLPIHISSDQVEAKRGKNSVRFYGNVVVKQKDVTMKCDDLTAYYAKGEKAIDKIVAHGNVSITQRNKKVVCGKATFYNAERKIVLEEAPTAWDGDNKISGGRMILLLEKNEIQILRSRKKPTELVIYPDKNPNLKGEPK